MPYLRLRDNSIWQFRPGAAPIQLDDNPATSGIVVDGNILYQLQNNGKIYRYEPKTPTWRLIDIDPGTVSITASGGEWLTSFGPSLWKLRSNGEILEYTPGLASAGTTWTLEDRNPDTVAIVADGGQLYQLHKTGLIWKYLGPPITGWELISRDPSTKVVCAGGTGPAPDGSTHQGSLYQLRASGDIFEYVGQPFRWRRIYQRLGNASLTGAIWVQDGWLFQVRGDGTILRFLDDSTWRSVDTDGLMTSALSTSAGLSLTTSGGSSPAPDQFAVKKAASDMLQAAGAVIALGAAVAGVGAAAIAGATGAAVVGTTFIAGCAVVGTAIAVAGLLTQPNGTPTPPQQINQSPPTPAAPNGPSVGGVGGGAPGGGHGGGAPGGGLGGGAGGGPVGGLGGGGGGGAGQGDDDPQPAEPGGVGPPAGEGEDEGEGEGEGGGGLDLSGSGHRRIEWAGTATWFYRSAASPPVWHEWDNAVPPHLLRTYKEFGQDSDFIYLQDQTAGSHLEIALGPKRKFYHYTDGMAGWHADTEGHWRT